MRALVALTLLVLLAAAIPGERVTVASSQTASLKVTCLVQSVPADGRSYEVVVISLLNQTGRSLIASSAFSVLLSSSNVGVGTVPPSVSFPTGNTYVLVNITTTKTAGSTTISASSQGIQSASIQVQTAQLSGFPTAIQVYAAPSQAVTQVSYTGEVVVELVDSRGNPAEAINNTYVTLASSNPRAVSLPQATIPIMAGQTLAYATYSSGLVPGSSVLQVSSAGLAGATATVNVLGSTPVHINVQASSNPTPPKSQEVLAVWLTDQNGVPVQASSDITLSISDSNTTQVTISSSATIATGNTYVDVAFTTKGYGRNPTKLTISSFNITSASTYITLQNPPTGCSTCQFALGMNLAPTTVLANGQAVRGVFVYLTYGGAPAKAASAIDVSLFSANCAQGPTILGINSSAIIPAGSSYTSAVVQPSFLVGCAQITAQATNVASAVAQMQTSGRAPSQLSTSAVPSILPATGGTFYSLEVGLSSSGSQPANAPSNVTLNLSSSNPAIASVGSSVSIPEGQSSAIVGVTTSNLPGSATITVSGSGYVTTSATITTIVPGASGLRLSVGPQPVVFNRIAPVGEMALQLFDSSGSPVRTKVPIQVTITGSNRTVFPLPLNVTFPVGANMILTQLHVGAAGSMQLTATSPGLLPATDSVQFMPYPLKATLKTTASAVLLNQGVGLTALVTVQGQPFLNANVTWSTDMGTVSPRSSLTNSSGKAVAQFQSGSAGTAHVVATLGISGLAPINLDSQILVEAPVTTTMSTTSETGVFGVDLYTLVGIVAAVVTVLLVVALVLVYTRRQKYQRASYR